MISLQLFVFLLSSISTINALKYDPEFVDHNLNQNQTATNPLDYNGTWGDGTHTYFPSPDNWRFPFYTVFLDRFVNGDPTNDDANGTQYEHDFLSNQFRNGGDIQGIVDSLDYLQGMGIKGIYIAGSPFINQPWAADSYSPLDLTLLDLHFGNITAWQNAITEIHRRDMYVLMDNTMATLGDLIGFEGFLNGTAPFYWGEHNGVYKTSRRYHDFDLINEQYKGDCQYPRYWTADGTRYGGNVTEYLTSCLQSDFDQYGDVESFGLYPEYQKQLSKFGFVQDRLRDYRPSVLDKIKRFSCIALQVLDFDGYRIDKGLTITLDSQASWSQYMRNCASALNKTNFFIPGEIVSGNIEATLYIGRGKEPQMAVQTIEEAFTSTNVSNSELYIRDSGLQALDAAVFHYSVYRSMCRFLSLDGIYAAERDLDVNWVDGWNQMLVTNDLINANTGKFDPRHLYGVTNQDVFRWPAIKNGTEKNLLGLYITTLVLPGIPNLMWGEEQADYILENTANNYLFGRKPMVSSQAWQIHGCYVVGTSKYPNFPLGAAATGCEDDSVSLDHRDPSHPVRNVVKRMYELRREFPVLNDGFNLTTLSMTVEDIYMPGSNGTKTEVGLYSVLRSRAPSIQDFGQGNQSIWLLYSNRNASKNFEFDCSSNDTYLLAPFDTGTTVRNLLYPYETVTLKSSQYKLGFEGSTEFNGCLDSITMDAWSFKAFVPVDKFVDPAPTITKFIPGHDYRQEVSGSKTETETIAIEIHFSQEMDCDSVKNSITINSNTESGSKPSLSNQNCSTVPATVGAWFNGVPATLFKYTADLTGVAHGIHEIVVDKPTSSGTNATSTDVVDRFLIRVGKLNNPMVFPFHANYSSDLLQKYDNGSLYLNHHAAGATQWRYSTNWGGNYSDWMDYTGANTTITKTPWSGTKLQEWEGDHVQVQYFSKLASSSNHIQHSDYNRPYPRRYPHMYVQGAFNQYSYDNGIPGTMQQVQSENSTWFYDFMYEWPTSFQLNLWGVNPDGRPDATLILGDVDGDMVLDRLPPGSLSKNVVNVTDVPPSPYVAWRIVFNEATMRYEFIGTGSQTYQIIVFILLWIVPVITALATIYVFMKAFYKISFNKTGANQSDAKGLIPLAVRRKFKKAGVMSEKALISMVDLTKPDHGPEIDALAADAGGKRRTVLIATMEYDIQDWAIKIKIGGLGVMAQLMGQNLGHQDIIWVVPCVGGVDYPLDQVAESMFITVLEKEYEVQVQYHVLRNVTYVLLDAPIFRKQSKSEPYPARMDDLESAIYYSAWNQCIAESAIRFNVDIYHINDYHGALAPLYLLPKVIPCCLSLHNAEFQGLWPMRNPKEKAEVCSVFNIDPDIVQRYVQFGEVFNLLHAGASYLRVHQKGFGAVGVSRKYGKRSFARYPIFWGLSKIGSLPNPDPSDTAEWHRDAVKNDNVTINPDFEAGRPELKRQAQEWAGLEQNPDAELFVFVGRWSMQKGIDLIADVFPSVLENYPKVQLICVGPVIDLYGRFAAMKLDKMMQLYPGRVYSKPEFTALPPFIFSGSEFALIPSRDEPFGLVAVEFGRKGALGVGAKVGGLGQMPGWWYSVESMTPKHLVHQFKSAIHDALASSQKTRAMMRARSAEQRFPVAQWIEDLETLQTTSIKVSMQENVGGFPKSPSMANLRTLFSGGHSNGSKTSFTQHRLGSTLSIPGTPGTPGNGPWTPSGGSMPSPGLSPMNPLSPTADDVLLPPPITPMGMRDSRRFSTLSYDSVAGARSDFQLQNVDPSFTDATGEYLREFEKKLEKLGGKSSENLLCIEENLIKSEKKFFNSYREAKMGIHHGRDSDKASLRPGTGMNSRATSIISQSRPGTPMDSVFEQSQNGSLESTTSERLLDSFPLGSDTRPPTGLKLWLLFRVGDWPIYSILLALGQIMAANSYQVTLLIGEIGQTATQLYVIASIYAATSLMWWWVFRTFKSVYVLSVPFAVYGLAFLCIGLAPNFGSFARGWVQNTATGLYAVASSSGSLYFALNFGDEGGAPIKSWVLRACLVQGTQQLYISALWYWGANLTELNNSGTVVSSQLVNDTIITSITIPLAVLMWVIGIVLFVGLPKYYRQAPGKVPSFYHSLFRRKIIMWFFVYVIIQNYFLSAPYGRNWRYLWTTGHAPSWVIGLLVLFFFVVVWVVALYFLSRLSTSHSWILPVFAIGLGAPRWCQMLWGTSGMGFYLPWAGSAVASAILGRCLWLWLGVLDALQGVGFGMLLLQTMTRFHISFTLIAAQVLGSIATILARLTAPNKTGPGSVFPNLALGTEGLAQAGFWIALGFQILVCFGFAAFFRKEQLSKP